MGLSRPQKPPSGVPTRWVSLFCIVSFFLGVLVVNRFWDPVEVEEEASSARKHRRNEVHPMVICDKDVSVRTGNILSPVSQTRDVIKMSKMHLELKAVRIIHTFRTLDKTISSLERQLAAARAAKADTEEGSLMVTKSGTKDLNESRRVFFVMGIITALRNRKRRNSIRETWMPQGEELKRLQKEKGIIIRFVIGHSSTPGGALDRAINAEEEQHKDFLHLVCSHFQSGPDLEIHNLRRTECFVWQNHIEGYHELSTKTQVYFSAVVAKWDADFYLKVDDDVHVNLGVVSSTLARHRHKPHVYIGCMKSGPVVAQKGIKYREPEYWKFGEGNKYFRHATGQIYAISKDLATYILVNRHILHRYANEDVSLGSWFIGLDVEHIDHRSLCCGTAPPDCEWKAKSGNHCGASFDWSCSGICKSSVRMKEVHQRCGEGDQAIWDTGF
ncbi:beta-1,6-galactosyltransferase GALT31A-like isoform X1 [Gossypium australe]|uniref:Hexosyltransferase n=1 Tax=Gossypium australe TaxID=47621 RepID=A0A5B6UE65_9ROSI|nr:beta-1,6-galactosyltransferase GALT31A-like isoform X1 [Gossypium australe]